MVENSEVLKKKFTYHPPKPGQNDKYVDLRSKALELASTIEALVPDCEESWTAIRRVEEAVMWANAGIARHG